MSKTPAPPKGLTILKVDAVKEMDDSSSIFSPGVDTPGHRLPLKKEVS